MMAGDEWHTEREHEQRRLDAETGWTPDNTLTEDEFDPLPADMMRARRERTIRRLAVMTGHEQSWIEATSGRLVHHRDGNSTNNRPGQPGAATNDTRSCLFRHRMRFA